MQNKLKTKLDLTLRLLLSSNLNELPIQMECDSKHVFDTKEFTLVECGQKVNKIVFLFESFRRLSWSPLNDHLLLRSVNRCLFCGKKKPFCNMCLKLRRRINQHLVEIEMKIYMNEYVCAKKYTIFFKPLTPLTIHFWTIISNSNMRMIHVYYIKNEDEKYYTRIKLLYMSDHIKSNNKKCVQYYLLVLKIHSIVFE